MPFVASLWVAIVVALLCAVLPVGAPASRLTGSAFNPATTSVVLKVRSPEPLQIKPAIRPDDDGLPVLQAPPLAVLAALFLVWRSVSRSPVVRSRPIRLAPAPRRRHRARAPPLR